MYLNCYAAEVFPEELCIWNLIVEKEIQSKINIFQINQ